jgi:hypothetical protein
MPAHVQMTFLNCYLTVHSCRPSNTSLKGGHRRADTVEPRREFIQDNSLGANVDVRAALSCETRDPGEYQSSPMRISGKTLEAGSEQIPIARKTLQFMGSAFGKLQPRAGSRFSRPSRAPTNDPVNYPDSIP